MNIELPDTNGRLSRYQLSDRRPLVTPLGQESCRVIYSAAHVVADPFPDVDPSGAPAIDWDSTMAFRRHLADLGLGIAEAMDTAQRGMGLDWKGALELVSRTKSELPDALVASGAGTDQLKVEDARTLDDVKRAYLEQIEAIQKCDSRIILMASRALAKVARGPEDYIAVYDEVLSHCDHPVILHWLGAMFDPELEGYWGASSYGDALEACLTVINNSVSRVEGIKVSLLDKDKEIIMRRRLPDGVKMYTGDDFNYPELIAGDSEGFSHALLGIFDPLAPLAATAVSRLDGDDSHGFRALLDPTVPLARHLFRAPTQHYKTGVVFLAWLNGYQDHFIMLNGAQSMRSLPYFVDAFKMADQCGLLVKPDLAVSRMGKLLHMYGV
jgi:hypothetical protein